MGKDIFLDCKLSDIKVCIVLCRYQGEERGLRNDPNVMIPLMKVRVVCADSCTINNKSCKELVTWFV